jgi:hypothetical protein
MCFQLQNADTHFYIQGYAEGPLHIADIITQLPLTLPTQRSFIIGKFKLDWETMKPFYKRIGFSVYDFLARNTERTVNMGVFDTPPDSTVDIGQSIHL